MQLKKILLFGKDGQVGRALCEALANKYQLVAVGKNELNLENIKLINQIIEDVNPDYLINAAAYTKVDQAEDENLLAVSINKVATEVMAKKTNSLGIPMIFYSTDYIFDGSNSSPYKEDDKPNNVVSDQQDCPTSSRWIADSTSKILNKLQEKKCYGTYNVVCDGVTNWFTFAQNILLMLEKKSYEKKLEFNQLTPIKSDKYPSKAKRPKNSVLSYQKLKSLLDINPPSWKNELNLVVDRIILMEN